MTTILQHFQRVTASEERVSCPRQIIAVGKRWSRHLEGLLHNHMSNPTVVVTVMEEAALYGNVHQVSFESTDNKINLKTYKGWRVSTIRELVKAIVQAKSIFKWNYPYFELSEGL